MSGASLCYFIYCFILLVLFIVSSYLFYLLFHLIYFLKHILWRAEMTVAVSHNFLFLWRAEMTVTVFHNFLFYFYKINYLIIC